MSFIRGSFFGVIGLVTASFAGQAAELKATYTFNNTLNAAESGPSALAATNPLGTNAFYQDSVYGNTRTVYAFNGNAIPVAQQGGLTFQNSSNLLSPTSYSLAMVFELSSVSSFRRLLDGQNRHDDRGLYIDGGHLDLAFGAVGSGTIGANQYAYVVISNDNGKVTGYLNGAQQFSVNDSQMNLNNANNPSQLVNLFLDNTAGAGQGEYSSGRIALFEAFNGALSASDVSGLAPNPFANIPGSAVPPVTATPEPATCSLVSGALLCVAAKWRKRKAQR